MGIFGNLFGGNKPKYTEDEIIKLKQEIDALRKEKEELSADIDILESGFYDFQEDFITTDEYKIKIKDNRELQKGMIRDKIAYTHLPEYRFNGDVKKGWKTIHDIGKQLLRCFNNECDVLISKLTIKNYSLSRDKLKKSYDVLNKLNINLAISISEEYFKLKLQELELNYKLELKKQDDKEKAREERERLREEAKLQKEIEEARKSINKEKTHFTQALAKLEKQLEANPTDSELLNKKSELEQGIVEADKKLADVDYRQQNTRAGYVYIISNIGAFGKDVYKIGMTRRLEPLDRVTELGDASVPFSFDVHAMIFTNDAPTLENALHKAFENNRINSVNYRKEFFKVNIDEIEKVVKENFKEKTVEFIKEPQAEQYYLSIKK